jgi:hypothetical protein
MDKRKGDLIYIPSNVTLLQFDNVDEETKPSFAKRFLSTTKPRRALLVKQSEIYCKILYEGEYWFVESRDIYDS